MAFLVRALQPRAPRPSPHPNRASPIPEFNRTLAVLPSPPLHEIASRLSLPADHPPRARALSLSLSSPLLLFPSQPCHLLALPTRAGA
eukprot:1218867-Rhodomonas_salina.3